MMLSLTGHICLARAAGGRSATAADLLEIFKEAYQNEPLVRVTNDIPVVKDNSCKHHVTVGGTL